MACQCCVAPFCCPEGPPADVTVEFYAPVVLDGNYFGPDPITPLLGTYVLTRDTIGEAYLGLDGISSAAYGLFPAGKQWQDGLSIQSAQWRPVPVGDTYIIVILACNSEQVSVSNVSLIAKAIDETTVIIFGVPHQTAYRTSFTSSAVSLTTSCGTSATSAEASQAWNHAEINFRDGVFQSSQGYFDTSKVKISVHF